MNGIDGLVLYCRTSPDRGRYRISPEWQLEQLREWTRRIGRPIVGEFIDRGMDGRTLGLARKEFWKAVERGKDFNAPIVAYHWQRLCRYPMKLEQRSLKGIDFLTYLSLDVPEKDFNEYSKRQSMKRGKQAGRPVHLSFATLWQVFQGQASGRSLRSIAKELSQKSGRPWDHRKIARLVEAHGLAYQCLL